MRQVAGFLGVINKVKLTEFYHSTLSYASVHGAKLPSLEEFLGVSLEQDSTFDEKTDAMLEAHAKKRLKERQSGISAK